MTKSYLTGIADQFQSWVMAILKARKQRWLNQYNFYVNDQH